MNDIRRFNTGILKLLLTAVVLGNAAAGRAEPIVRIGTNLGDLFITLTPEAAPNTVANFRTYVENGNYNDTFFHFSQPAAAGVNGELHTGKFVWPQGNGVRPALQRDPVADEFNRPNSRGTVAMVREGNQANTATNSWMINTSDNSSGSTVFGVLNARSLELADEIAALSIEDLGDNFEQTPLIDESFAQPLRQRVVLILDSEEFESISDPVAAVLPGSRTVPVGVPATAFASLLNTDNNSAVSCRIAAPASLQGTFEYQLTNPLTNEPTGSINPLVDVPGGGAATFIFAITPTANFASTEFVLDFNCGNAQNSATSIAGVNTFTLGVPAGLSSDVVAIAKTPANNGVNDIPQTIGSGAFAVATVNLGDEEVIRVSADDGGAQLPLEFFVCRTNPISGLCETLLASSVEQSMVSGSTNTFTVVTRLTQANGNIPFSPAGSRAYVRFRNSGGELRGSTSVALRTLSE